MATTCPSESNSPGTISIINTTTNGTTYIPQACADHDTLDQVLGDVFIMIGAIAMLMIVLAGMRYVLARGQPDKVTQARNIIQYAVIGLIIASLAYAIVSFVITNAGT